MSEQARAEGGAPAKPEPVDVHLVALSPAEMGEARQGLIGWCRAKAAACRAEAADLEQNLAIARESGWTAAPWERRLRRERARITFYGKIERALRMGFFLIPPLPSEVFAVREAGNPDPMIVGQFRTPRSATAAWPSSSPGG